jgi:acid phosphatase type 7
VIQNWLEPLFQQYQVDLYFSGHAHLYSRTYPTYHNQPTQFNFTNPSSTVYVVAGGAGNREGLEKLSDPQPNWAAGGLDTEYGYGVMSVLNNTHLTWVYYRADTDAIVDTFTLVKNQHP